MPLLNRTLQYPLYEVLRASEWGERAFDVKWKADPLGIVDIVFIPDPQYAFHGTYSNTNLTHLAVREMPGARHAEEHHVLGEAFPAILYDRVGVWLANLRADLEARPKISRRYENLRKMLDEMIEQKDVALDEIFSVEEQNDLLAKLNELKSDIEDLERDNKLTREELEKATEEIEKLKMELDFLSRGTWFRSFVYRTMIIGDAVWHQPEARQILLSAGKTFVSQGTQKLLGMGNQ